MKTIPFTIGTSLDDRTWNRVPNARDDKICYSRLRSVVADDELYQVVIVGHQWDLPTINWRVHVDGWVTGNRRGHKTYSDVVIWFAVQRMGGWIEFERGTSKPWGGKTYTI